MGFNSGFKGLITYLVIYLLTYLLITYLLTCLVSYLLTPCSRVHFSASQEIPHVLWSPKDHYGFHKCPIPDPILSQIDPIHAPTSHFHKIHLNIILPLCMGLQVVSFTQVSPQKPCIHLCSPPCILHALSSSFFSI